MERKKETQDEKYKKVKKSVDSYNRRKRIKMRTKILGSRSRGININYKMFNH